LIDRKNSALEIRAGFGAIQVSANNQHRVKDDKTAGVVVIENIYSFDQKGLEYGLSWTGKWNATSDYSLTADLLTPLGEDIPVGDICANCSDSELTNIDIKAKIGTKISNWATLSYEYKAIKQPRLLDRFQILHGFVLNIVYESL